MRKGAHIYIGGGDPESEQACGASGASEASAQKLWGREAGVCGPRSHWQELGGRNVQAWVKCSNLKRRSQHFGLF